MRSYGNVSAARAKEEVRELRVENERLREVVSDIDDLVPRLIFHNGGNAADLEKKIRAILNTLDEDK